MRSRHSTVAFGVIIVSIAVDFYRARALTRVAVETASPALEADALHFSSDMWSSAAVLLGLVGMRLGYPWADSAAAMVVAVFVCFAGWRLGRRTIDALTDTAPEGVAERITPSPRRSRKSPRSSGCGPDGRRHVFGEVDVGASRTLPLDRIEAMKEDIGAAVRTALPNAEIGVNVMPRALDDETVMERVMVIARNRGLPCTTSPSTRSPPGSPSRSISRSRPAVARRRPRYRRRPRSRNPQGGPPSSRWRPTSSRCSRKAGGPRAARPMSPRSSRRSPNSRLQPARCATCTTYACANRRRARS